MLRRPAAAAGRPDRDLPRAASRSASRPTSSWCSTTAGATACPAAIGAVAAVGGRVKLRCGGASRPVGRAGGARDRLLPRGGRALQGHGRAAPRRCAAASEHGFLNVLAATTAPPVRSSRRCSRRRTRPRSTSPDADRALFVGFGSCSWREPVEDLRRAGAAVVTLAYGVLRGGGVCARVDGARGGPARRSIRSFDAPSLNALMAAGPEAGARRAARVDEGREVAGAGARHAVRGGRLRRLLLVAPPRDEPRAACSGPDAEPLLPNWRHLPVGYHGRAGTVVPSGTPVQAPGGQRPGGEFGPSARLDIELEAGFVIGTPSRWASRCRSSGRSTTSSAWCS